MKYFLVECDNRMTDWVIVVMPKSTTGEPRYENDDDAGMMYNWGNWEEYIHKGTEGKLFRNLAMLKKYLRACKDWEYSNDKEASSEASHWINRFVKSKDIVKETAKYGGLNAVFYEEDNQFKWMGEK